MMAKSTKKITKISNPQKINHYTVCTVHIQYEHISIGRGWLFMKVCFLSCHINWQYPCLHLWLCHFKLRLIVRGSYWSYVLMNIATSQELNINWISQQWILTSMMRYFLSISYCSSDWLYKQCVHFLLQKGFSLMWWACYCGQANVVTLLLDSGADVNLPTVSKFTVRPQKWRVSL